MKKQKYKIYKVISQLQWAFIAAVVITYFIYNERNNKSECYTVGWLDGFKSSFNENSDWKLNLRNDSIKFIKNND